MSSKATLFAFASVVLFSLSACESLQKTVNPPVEAIVVVPPSNGAYLVESSANLACEQGVRALRSEEWEKAVTAFKQALLDDAEDDNAHFGIALAYERLGKNDLALTHYETANRIPREPNSMYADSVARMRAKLGR